MSQNEYHSWLTRCLKLRRLLRKHLADDYPKYMTSVRDWLRKRKTRAELDLEISSYLQPPVRKVHSEFLISLSKLCCGRLSLRLDTPRAQLTTSSEDLIDLCNTSRGGRLVVDLSNDDEAQLGPFLLYKKVYTDQDLCGVELIKARFYLAAWDQGLSGVDSKVGRVLYYAMRHYIKDILHAAILHRGTKKSYSNSVISGLDIWHSTVQTNYDLPAVPYCFGVSSQFRHQRHENRPV